MDNGADMTREEFVQELREALNHLYDPNCLRRSPLATLFGVANRFDTPSALQRILIEAIQGLKPRPDQPVDSSAWEVYVALSYRYIEQLKPAEVANQLSISERHLRRKERMALEALADFLWDKFELGKLAETVGNQPAEEVAAGTPGVSAELSWLKDSSLQHRTDPARILPDLLGLAHKLAERYTVHLQVDVAENLLPLATNPVALRQVLLNLLSVAIPRASGGRVLVSAQTQRCEVIFRIQCFEYPSGPKPALSDENELLNMAHQLATLSGGRVTLAVDTTTFDAIVSYPAIEQLPVLVIDDNADTLQLFRRYTEGTRYRMMTARDPEEALRLAEKNMPQVIVLDVMMPQMDGWALMAQLQQNPLTAHIPIVVCTILPQKDLAMLLGANEFVRKPVTRQAFLDALDRALHSEGAPG